MLFSILEKVARSVVQQPWAHCWVLKFKFAPCRNSEANITEFI